MNNTVQTETATERRIRTVSTRNSSASHSLVAPSLVCFWNSPMVFGLTSKFDRRFKIDMTARYGYSKWISYSDLVGKHTWVPVKPFGGCSGPGLRR